MRRPSLRLTCSSSRHAARGRMIRWSAPVSDSISVSTTSARCPTSPRARVPHNCIPACAWLHPQLPRNPLTPTHHPHLSTHTHMHRVRIRSPIHSWNVHWCGLTTHHMSMPPASPPITHRPPACSPARRSIAIQSVAGATQTGTHGTGKDLGSMSSQIKEFWMLLANGTVVHASEHDLDPSLFNAGRGAC